MRNYALKCSKRDDSATAWVPDCRRKGAHRDFGTTTSDDFTLLGSFGIKSVKFVSSRGSFRFFLDVGRPNGSLMIEIESERSSSISRCYGTVWLSD